MLLKDVNIKDELLKEKFLTDEIDIILNNEVKKDKNVLDRLKKTEHSNATSTLPNLNSNLIFSINQIEKICVTYHLRFLDSQYFKSEFPYEAIMAIKKFEKENSFTITNFKIIAPSSVFDLKDVNQDPLLFAQLPNNKYYLLHQWGNDLKWYRKYLYYPIRNVYTYFHSIIALSLLVALIIPSSWLQVQQNNEIYMRVWLTLHCTIGFFFFIFFIGATVQASFSSMSWKSKFYNE